MADEKLDRIWLEVADVQLDGGTKPLRCKVQLKADKEYPKPLWWRVEAEAISSNVLDVYKEILREIDKKRVVLAGLTWKNEKEGLHCNALRFQSADLGSR